MCGAKWVIGVAGIALMALAGCVVPDTFRLSALGVGSGNDRVVAASLETVSASTQTGLKHLNISVVESTVGQDLRLAATTPGGDHFTIVLSRVATAQGERTRVRVEGASSDHQDILFRLFAQAESPNAAAK